MALQEQWWTLKDLTEPEHNVLHHYKNYWWVYDPTRDAYLVYIDPQRPKTYYPQCNMNKTITERLHPSLEIKQIPHAFLPLNLDEYRD